MWNRIPWDAIWWYSTVISLGLTTVLLIEEVKLDYEKYKALNTFALYFLNTFMLLFFIFNVTGIALSSLGIRIRDWNESRIKSNNQDSSQNSSPGIRRGRNLRRNNPTNKKQ